MSFMKRSVHLQLAQNYWKSFLKKGDIVIDATCGNGFDSIFLAKHILTKTEGFLFLYDIQKQAIANTRYLLENNLEKELLARALFFHKSHEDFEEVDCSPHLIVYNLGYLPKSDKMTTTTCESTLKSLQKAFAILHARGAVSIMCYPGHEEGEKELAAVEKYLKTLDASKWEVCHHQWLNRKKSPVLFWITRRALQ